jgi:hypothetical protein
MKRFSLFCLGSLLLTLSVRAIVDLNGNGISDIWERQYNNGQPFNPPIDPAADPDSDGWTNAQESAVGTNPFDAESPSGFLRPDIINIPAVWGEENGNPVLITPKTIRVSWQTIPGKKYTLLFSPDLTAESWLPIEDAYLGNGTITEYYFPLVQPTINFWRVKIEDVDSDGDGLTSAEEMALGLDPNQPQSLSGIDDAWLAKNFTDLLLSGGFYMIDPNADPDGDGISTLEEFQGGTDPNSADPEGSRKWVTVQGNGAALEEITKTGTLTIPAGQSAVLVVAIASEEFPDFTGVLSEYNDLLEWHVTPSQGTSMNDSINVNERHVEWEMAMIDDTTLPGLPSPVHIEQTRVLTALPDSDLTIQVEISATNYSDGALPSLVSVGLLPVEVEQEDYTSAKGIRFCRWLDSFEEIYIDSDCANKDRDRFRIRIPAVLPNLTKIRIMSSVMAMAVIGGQSVWKNSDGDYDVTMTAEDDAMVSTWMLLVGDGEDDVAYNGIGTENETDDQTLLADFNSPIEVTFPELNNGKVVFSAQKPLGDVEIQPYYLSPAGDVPPEIEPFIRNHLEKMKEIYRQIGVRVGYYGIEGEAVPQAWFNIEPDANSWGDYYYLNPSESDLARAAVRGLSVPSNQIRIGYVDTTVMLDGNNEGDPWKIVRGFTGLGADGIIVSLDEFYARLNLGTTAHEVGHTLGLPHTTTTTNWKWLLMKDGGTFWEGSPINHSKRFELGDIDIIRNHPSFYVPIPN